MGESRAVVEELLSLCLQRISMEQSSIDTEREFLEMAKSFEDMRKRCLIAESELKKYKELLVKSDVAKAALDVKLKHVRNQLDLEMQKHLRVERDFQYLQRQMQLMCDILVQDSKSSSYLNDEQKCLLATFEHKNQNGTLHRTGKRLCVIDESSFLSHSDISYDRTDDDVDLDCTVLKPLKSRARERRRSSMGKKCRTNVTTEVQTQVQTQVQDRLPLEKEVETIVKATVLTHESAQIHMVVGVTQNQGPRLSQEMSLVQADQTSVWQPSEDTIEPETVTRTEEFFRNNSSSSAFSNICSRTPMRGQTPGKTGYNMSNSTATTKHVFIHKTVIRPESCCGCGKRMRFGKGVVKCRNCRVVVHPEYVRQLQLSATLPIVREIRPSPPCDSISPAVTNVSTSQLKTHLAMIYIGCRSEMEK
uniref:Phorbol-ester/DAG-type domain-containing protein n=1 Tax=Knipowitschia caucasica TaxID=637954 RepID=A0AAV2KZJ9_KNICA